MIAAPVVGWGTIGKVVAVSLVAALVATSAFAVAILGATRSAEMRRGGRAFDSSRYALLGLAGAAVCAAAIAGGIVVMTTR